MKNIFLLKTDNPSRLWSDEFNVLRYKNKSFFYESGCTWKNIYITSDDKFIKDEYVTDGLEVIKAHSKLVNAQGHVNRRDWKKIILTTDEDLIKDGIQAIDNEFLEWFVKNSSCEKVEVIDHAKRLLFLEEYVPIYKIIIPTEEPRCLYDKPSSCENSECRVLNKCMGHRVSPKQETLEQFISKSNTPEGLDQFSYDKGLKDGAKWQQKVICNEENVGNLLNWLNDGISIRHSLPTKEELMNWFDQFKKK